MRKYIIFIFIFILILQLNADVKVKIKNLVTIEGLNENSIIGYGLVSGLNRTGDSKKFNISQKILSTILDNLGVDIEDSKMESKNSALVLITAKLPPNAKAGEKINVNVASIGDAKDISSGILLQAPLKGLDNNVYALAEGVIAVEDNMKKKKSIGIIPSGAILQKDFSSDIIKNNKIILLLTVPDFNTIIKIRDAIIEKLPELSLNILNDKIIEINITDEIKNKIPELLSQIENIEVVPDLKAKIVINKESGVIVINGDVKLLESAISYKNIDIYVKNNKQSDKKNVFYINESSDIQSLIDGLNKLGAKTEDIINILYTLRKAGSLFADIIID